MNEFKFIGEPLTPATAVGVRSIPHKITEDANIETQFKQELNNPSVRDLKPQSHEETIDYDADLMIADLKQQLDDARRIVETWHELWKIEKGRTKDLQKNWFKAMQCSSIWYKRYQDMKEENEDLRSSRWFRFSRWLYRQWHYDIYRGY